MAKYFWQILLIFALGIYKIKASDEEYVIKSDQLPFIWSNGVILANGHLGYGFFSDRMEVNCVFNYKSGDSNRVRIPNWGNITVSKVLDSNQKDYIPESKTFYEMNTRTGIFQWQTDIPSLSLKIIQRTYAHRFYNRGLIYELLVQRTNAQDSLELQLTQIPGLLSRDMNFYIITNNKEWMVMKGIAMGVEDIELQKDVAKVFIVQSENLENGKILKLERGQYELNYRFILTVDEKEEVAKKEAKKLMSLTSQQIMDDHVKEWTSFWQSFNVQIEGNLELSQIVNAGIFYMASAMPSLNSFQPNEEFCGLSPNGIGRGKDEFGIGEKGNTYWVTEYFMLPVIAQFSNYWAKELFRYREKRLPAARINAKRTGYIGAKYPWQSAFTGVELSLVNRDLLYVPPGIINAVKSFFSVTNDKCWLCHNAWPMVKEIAEFLTDRVSWNSTSNQYHLKEIELFGSTLMLDDSAYINVCFKLALEFASYVQKNCESGATINLDWKNIADNIFVPYDPELDYHPLSANFNINDIIEQPETMLWEYPLGYKINLSTHINDLNIYESVTTRRNYSQTWPMFVVNFLDINETEKADFYFRKSYKDYVLPEFKIWNILANPNIEASNYHTGFASFFQSIMNGYAGIRFHHSDQISIMEIKQRRLLPDTKAFKIHGISFAGSTFELSIKEPNTSILTCLHLGDKSLELKRGKERQHIYKGFSIDLGSEVVYIQTI